MNDKNQKNDFLTISEFAEIVGMTKETLRHYDQSGVFRPAKQGIEFENKYRYYSPTQITTAKIVRVLADIGVPLKTIRELAQSRTPEKLIKLLCKHKDIIADELRFFHEVFTVISIYLELITTGISAIESEIHVAQLQEKRILLGGENNLEDSISFHREYIRFCHAQHEPKLNLMYPIGGYWDSMDVFLNEPEKATRFFSHDPNGNEQKAAGLYMIGYTRGSYSQSNDLPERMVAFSKKNGLLFNGPVYRIYLFDELSITDPENYLIQISASVKETRRTPARRPNRRL